MHSTYTQLVKGLRSLVRAASVLLAVALLSASDQGLAQQPRVEHLVDDNAGSFSPDAKTIVFERWFSTQRYGVDPHPVGQRAVLLVMRADRSSKRILRHPEATFEYDATFSPDGRSILFVRDERIYLMRRDGSNARPVRRDFLEQACPRFSPDGSMISFWRGSTARRSGAYFVMNADGTGLRRIVNSGGEIFAWGLPLLVFGREGARVRQGLQPLCRFGGRHEPRADHDDKDGTLYRPSVSPDGRWIACDGDMARRYGYGIFVMRANGTGMRRITTGANEVENDAGASWAAPDGERIVFSGHRGRLKGAGDVVNRDGSGLHRLSNFAR